jgi:hypothetical protein
MIKTIILSMCLATSSLSLNARAQDERAYTEGPVTEVDYIQVDYKVFRATPKSPDQPTFRRVTAASGLVVINPENADPSESHQISDPQRDTTSILRDRHRPLEAI